MDTLSQKLTVRKAGRGGGGAAGAPSAGTSAGRPGSNDAPSNGRAAGGGAGPNGAAVAERQAVQETNLDAQHAKLYVCLGRNGRRSRGVEAEREEEGGRKTEGEED